MTIPEKLAAIRERLEREGCGDCDALLAALEVK